MRWKKPDTLTNTCWQFGTDLATMVSEIMGKTISSELPLVQNTKKIKNIYLFSPGTPEYSSRIVG
jgi:hypothetical protein